MKIITKNKTTELIKLAHNEYKLIVCFDRKEAAYIFNMARKLKYEIAYPITYQDFLNKDYFEANVKSILIDNVDRFIQSISKVPVEAMTLTLSKKPYKGG